MNNATGSESTPTRRICTINGRAHVRTSDRAASMSITKWPTRPTSSMAATVRRPITSITGGEATARNESGQDFSWPLYSGSEARESFADVSVAQSLECAVAQLTNAFACDAQHSADLFERMLTSTVETEIEAQHFCIAALQRIERLLDLIRQEAIHRLIFRIRQVLGDEALDERAVTIGVERRVEPHVARVERGERPHDLERQLRCIGDLFGR